jgi:hypothetical protein
VLVNEPEQDANYQSAALAGMNAGERDGTFAVDKARYAGCASNRQQFGESGRCHAKG